MKRYIEHLIRNAEKRTENFLAMQIRDPQDNCYGLYANPIRDCKPTIFFVSSAISVYYTGTSRFYKDPALCEAMHLAIDGIAAKQRENGFFDLPNCNFFSAPDSSFSFMGMQKTWKLLKKYADTPETFLLLEKYSAVLKKTAEAISTGGFHTPNHRWAICAALSQAINMFGGEDPDFAERLKKRIDQYLVEGIDGNEDGEYAERSTGGYNMVVNSALVTLFEETGDNSYLDYVVRNLNMMFCYIDPDDTIFTQNSTRQDKGKDVFMDGYFFHYLMFAAYNGKGNFKKLDDELIRTFDAAAHKIIKDSLLRGASEPECLISLMLHPEMLEYEFKGYGFPRTYRKYFKDSGLLRVKTEKYTYTALSKSTAFLFFNVNGLEVYLKIGESYCAIRNFIPSQIEVTDDGVILEADAQGWYYLPWKENQGTADWWKMDNKKRELDISSTLHTRAAVRELEDGLEIHLTTDGLDRLPLRLELCVPADVTLDNSHFCLKTPAGQSMILRDDTMKIKSGVNTIEFGPGFGEHEYGGHYSHEEVNANGFSVYCNAYTSVDQTFYLKVK